MGLSFMKCGRVACEKARLIDKEFCEEHQPAEPQEDAQLKFKVQSLIGCAGDICWPCSHRTDEIVGLIQAAEQRATRAALPSVDELAQIIRKVDGGHDIGAGALAEGILAALTDKPAAPQPDRLAAFRALAREMLYSADTLDALGSKAEAKSLRQWGNNLSALIAEKGTAP